MDFRARLPTLVLAATVGVAFLATLGAFAVRDSRQGDRFDILRWELATLPNKWLFLAGSPLRDDPDHDEAIARYFALTSDERNGPEGRRLENVVEAAIEGRITEALADMGLRGRIGFFPGSTFPPVAFELAPSPRVLVLSPRDRIMRAGDTLLRPDLPLARAVGLEARAEQDHPNVSALVIASGGLALYPAVVTNERGYYSTVVTAAHEWVHHYLLFYPLGWNYFATADTQIINETVADLVAVEVAARVIARYGDPTLRDPDQPAPAPVPAPPPDPPVSPVDRIAILRELRIEVDELLAAGNIERAEERMEEVRQELLAGGISVRRINQAYFAWFGTYAARPDAVDPIGRQLRQLRDEAGSLPAFLRTIRGITTRAEVEALLGEPVAARP